MATQITSLRVRLTDAIIEKATLPDGLSEFTLIDEAVPELRVRIRSGGTKTFALRYRPKGGGRRERPRTFTIGRFPSVTEKDARKEARIRIGEITGGKDPAGMRREQKQVERQSIESLIGLAQDKAKPKDDDQLRTLAPYEAHLIRRQKAKYRWSLSAVRRGLAKHMKLDIRNLTRSMVLDEMNRLTDAGKPGAASYFRKEVGTFLNWVANDYKLAGFKNPMDGYKRARATRAERLHSEEKDGRALSPDEIRKVWHAAGKAGAFGLLVRMCLLGGPRRSEPTFIEWGKHVMPDRIIFDPEATKMGSAHAVPRTDLVNAVLDDAKRFRCATSDLVFPSSKTGGKIAGFSKLVPKLRKASGVNFRMHDLRRTLRTAMSQCGYDNTVQRLCVGQKVPGIDGIYNKNEQWVIRSLAFESVHDHFAELIGAKRGDKNIVRLNPLNKVKAELLGRLHEFNASA